MMFQTNPQRWEPIPPFRRCFFSFKTCSNTSVSGWNSASILSTGMRPSAFSTTCGSKESKTCNLGLTAPGEPRVDVMETKRGGKMDYPEEMMIYRYYSQNMNDQCWPPSAFFVFCSQESTIVALFFPCNNLGCPDLKETHLRASEWWICQHCLSSTCLISISSISSHSLCLVFGEVACATGVW